MWKFIDSVLYTALVICLTAVYFTATPTSNIQHEEKEIEILDSILKDTIKIQTIQDTIIQEIPKLEKEFIDTIAVDTLFTEEYAKFEKWILPGKRRYNRIFKGVNYSDDPRDAGNYNSKGKLVGTMMSIAAKSWEDYIGKSVTKKDMLNITTEQALKFYKQEIWDKVKADSIKCQVIAEMLADMKSNAGYNGVKQLQKVLGIEQTGVVNNKMIEIINNSNFERLYEDYRLQMLRFYRSLNNPTYEKGWINDMNKYYPKRNAQSYVVSQTAHSSNFTN